ncbi:restriction endonuclease subunit S [Leptolyngbya sp. FACHB-671]|uniref:restriction endonuclease subunit S n=1 Tax=Leptolyngbya sp. FACHB-671 TaxID=2692812 RepID=UPI0016831149|nr:restriction endonuclease subunit S [Leptolyngbya sp. FACHB-671]MBD2072098.1 restriction endonuclease subunit S [Leptolyngbya sp. FACHB-671]
MNLLEKHFDLAFAAPDGIQKLRELILTLAMQGKLVPQDPSDQPASELLETIAAEKTRLVKEGKIKQSKPMPEIKPEEVPYELPHGWEWVRLGEIGESNIGLTYAPSDISDTGTPVLRSNNIQNGKLDLTDLKRVNKDIKENVLVQKGDLLICARNGSKALVGKTALITDLSEDMAFGAFMAIFRSRFNEFLLYFINSPLFRRMIDEVNTMTINQITQGNLKSTICPLPPLAEQHRIVAKIDRLMARCNELEKLRAERNEKRITIHTAACDRLLTAKESNDFSTAWRFIMRHFGELSSVKENVAELRKAILQLAVMGKLVPQDPNDEPASELLRAISAEKEQLVKEGTIKQPKPLPEVKPEEVPYQLPKGWEWTRLGDVSLYSDSGWSPQCLSEPRSGQEWGVLKVSAVSWGEFRPEENKALPRDKEAKPEYEVRVGDFLLSRANTQELVARSVIVKETPDRLMMSDKIVRFTLSQKVEKTFINFANLSRFARDYYARNASGTSSSMKNISREVMNNLPIPLPPPAEQRRIVTKIERLMAFCDELDQWIEVAADKQSELLNALVPQV